MKNIVPEWTDYMMLPDDLVRSMNAPMDTAVLRIYFRGRSNHGNMLGVLIQAIERGDEGSFPDTLQKYLCSFSCLERKQFGNGALRSIWNVIAWMRCLG